MDKRTKKLLSFLQNSPSPWHAVDEIKTALTKEGFKELKAEDKWQLKPSGRYFVTHDDSTIAAFILPKNAPQSLHLISSHTDSPSLKLKPHAEYAQDEMGMLGVEAYGSPLITSWLNRDLGIAGRISVLKKAKRQEFLVNLKTHPITLPQLAIHLEKEQKEKEGNLNLQQHLAALFTLNKETTPSLEELLQEQTPFDTLLDHDLFLYPLEPPRLIGYQQEMIASYRIDSLLSVDASTTALLCQKPDKERVKLALFSNHEEIGSFTAEGAGSPFLPHVIERISLAFDTSREAYLRLLAKAVGVSVDLAHAKHPNYKDRHEPRHKITLGGGISVKYNAQQRYASTAPTAAQIILLCQKHNLKWQKMVNRGDIRGGSTIGPIQAANSGISTVDIGSPQLSMHSCRELAATEDHLQMCTLLTHFLAD